MMFVLSKKENKVREEREKKLYSQNIGSVGRILRVSRLGYKGPRPEHFRVQHFSHHVNTNSFLSTIRYSMKEKSINK